MSPTSLSTALTSLTTTRPSCVVPNIDFSLGGISGLGVSLAEAHGTDGVELASPMAKKLASLSAYNWDILSSASPCGSNCSYELQFNRPAWKCTPSSVDNSSAVGAFQAPTPSVFGSNTGNMWLHSPSYLADFSNETGLFWVGSSIHVDYDNNVPNGGLNIAIFYCENWNATYSLRINYTPPSNPLSFKISLISTTFLSPTYWKRRRRTEST